MFTFENMSQPETPTPVAKRRTQATTRLSDTQADRLEALYQERLRKGHSSDFAGMVAQMIDFCSSDPIGKDLFRTYRKAPKA